MFQANFWVHFDDDEDDDDIHLCVYFCSSSFLCKFVRINNNLKWDFRIQWIWIWESLRFHVLHYAISISNLLQSIIILINVSFDSREYISLLVRHVWSEVYKEKNSHFIIWIIQIKVICFLVRDWKGNFNLFFLARVLEFF